MKQNVTREQIVKQLVKVFRSSEILQYNATNECRQGVCGWCGVMAPLSRPAYIADFGLDVVEAAEAVARRIIEEDRKRYEASRFHAFELEAERHKTAGQPAPQEGSFMWAVYSGLKCDGGEGIYDELRSKLYEDSRGITRLVKVDKVYHVTEEEFKQPETADKIAQLEDCPGGWRQEEGDYLDKEKMNFTYTAAVISPSGRYYLIDNEGFSYARYILTPVIWREMFSEEVAQIKEENRKAMEESERQAEEARGKRLADYQARCRKWEHLMTEVSSYRAEVERLRKEKGWDDKAYKAAERKLNSVKRANILAMCNEAFPGVKFSLKKHSGWGADWELSWEDGPTEETFSGKTNLELFSTYHDTFNGWDDSTDVSYEEFTEFAHKYMGSCNSIDIERTLSKEKKAELIAEVVAIVPGFDSKNAYGYYNSYAANEKEANLLEAHFGLDYYTLFGNRPGVTAEELARRVWNKKEYLPEVKEKKPTFKAATNTANLQLIDYSEKAVVVTGNTRDYAEELKALGGRFNGKLKCGAGWVFSKKREPELRTAFAL